MEVHSPHPSGAKKRYFIAEEDEELEDNESSCWEPQRFPMKKKSALKLGPIKPFGKKFNVVQRVFFPYNIQFAFCAIHSHVCKLWRR